MLAPSAQDSERQRSEADSSGLVEQNYRALIELCPDALVVHDGRTVILANHAMAGLVGVRSVQDLIGTGVLEFVAPSSQALVEERIGNLHQAGQASLVDEVWRRSDGSEVQVEVAAAPMPWVGPRAAMVIARDVTERRRLEGEREALLAEKELLMREVNHRVANSLQFVQGLLRMQARRAESGEVRTHLSQASARIGTIGTLHRRLQKDCSVVEGDVKAYMEGVIADLRIALGETHDRQIILESCDAGVLVMKADMLVSLGLIVAEAVANSMKHGAGHIRVWLCRCGGQLELSVQDEGPGFPKGFDAAKDGQGLGMRMISSLIKARRGRIVVGAGEAERDTPRSRITAIFPL